MIGILLIVVGVAGFGLGGMMFGDIGIAAMIGGAAALLSGIGIMGLSKRIAALEQNGVKLLVVGLLSASVLSGAGTTYGQSRDECADWKPSALANASVKRVEACLRSGANPNARDKHGRSRLHWFAHSSEDPDTIRVVVAAGANVDARNLDKQTPLHTAAFSNGNPAIHAALIEAGANVNARDNRDNTPLHTAAQWNGNPNVIVVLLDAGADLTLKNKKKKTPLDLVNPALMDTPAYQRLGGSR